jgi:hypothetical protein
VGLVQIDELIDAVKSWQKEKAQVRADYFKSPLETCTVVGTPALITDTAFGVWSNSASIRIDVKNAEKIARADNNQLEIPSGASMIQGEQFDDHFWVILPDRWNFLIGKRKS